MSDEDDIWWGEEHLSILNGVAHVEDGRMVYYEGAKRDGEHYDAFVAHGGGEISLSTAYDDGDVDIGSLVSITPDEARRLGDLLHDAADYEEERQNESTTETASYGQRLREVLLE